MPAKTQAKNTIKEFTVNVRVSGELSINVPAESLEAAVEHVRGFCFNDLVSADFDNLSIDTEVTGVFKNQ